MDLGDRAHRHPLAELVAAPGERGGVGEAPAQRGRHGEDGAPGTHAQRAVGRRRVGRVGVGVDEAGADHHSAGTVRHRLGRGAEDHPVAELVGHALRQLLGATGEAPLLRAAGAAGEVGQPTAGVEVEQREEERELARSGAEDGLDGDLEDVAGRRRAEVGVEPGGQRLGVQRRGIGRLPGGVERDLEGGQVEVEHGGDAVGGPVRVRGGDQARRRARASRHAAPPPGRSV